ncbi:MAG: BBP7 family outer membrane beta-barrel protein [Pirellulales bacterium]|nr:BBP7 family outer membrane beta-barrel protein [Pirellulales bacterium]
MRATLMAVGLAALVSGSASAQYSSSRTPYAQGYRPRPRAAHEYPVHYQPANPFDTPEAPLPEDVDAPRSDEAAADTEAPLPDDGHGDDCCDGYGDDCDYADYCDDGCCPSEPCAPPCSAPCGAPCDSGRCMSVWVNLDFMALWLKGDKLPPLVTTSDPGTSAANAGVNGLSTTHVLFGDGRVNRDFRAGGRVQTGMWFNPEQTVGIDGHYYQIATAAQNFYSQANYATPDPYAHILAIPTINGATGVQNATLIAHPSASGGLSGSVAATSTSDILSAGGGGRMQLWGDCCGCTRVYGTGGYRFFRLDEGLTLETNSLSSQGTQRLATYDRFLTSNQFQGGYFGTLAQVTRGPLWLWVAPQIAIGNMQQVANISGATGPLYGTPTVGSGILTRASNIGHRWRDHFAYIPEIDMKIGYQITPNFVATLGYNFTFLSSVVRPGTVINPAIGGTQPQFAYNATSLWMQAATAGFQLRF